MKSSFIIIIITAGMLGNFSIWLRAYWPDQAVLDGIWKPPPASCSCLAPLCGARRSPASIISHQDRVTAI